MNEDTPKYQVEWVDENGKIYNSILTFKEDAPIEEKMHDLFEMRIICEEKDCNRYELLTKECLKIHTHEHQQFE